MPIFQEKLLVPFFLFQPLNKENETTPADIFLKHRGSDGVRKIINGN